MRQKALLKYLAFTLTLLLGGFFSAPSFAAVAPQYSVNNAQDMRPGSLTSYDVRQYGMRGDVHQLTGIITDGTSGNVDDSSMVMTTSLIGQKIVIPGAGAAGVDYAGTVTAYVSTTRITVSPATGTAVTGATATFGTDNRTLLNTTVSSTLTKGTLAFSHGDYWINSNLTIPAGFCLDFTSDGAIYLPTGVTLTTSCLHGPLTQIIKGGGTIAMPHPDLWPEWFGAVGDGVTDDGPALQKMMDVYKASGNGGPFNLAPLRTYLTNNSVTSGATNEYCPNLTIEGNGATIKNNSPTLPGLSITAATPNLASATPQFIASDVGKVLFIRGAGAGGIGFASTITAFVNSTHVTLMDNASTTVTSGTGMFPAKTFYTLRAQGDNVTVKDLAFRYTYEPVPLTDSFIGSDIHTNESNQLDLGGEAGNTKSHIQVLNCKFYGAWYSCVRPRHVADLLVQNCYFENSLATAVFPGGTQKIVIDKNEFHNSKDDHIYVQGYTPAFVDGVWITNNWLIDGNARGIGVGNAKNVHIENNKIENTYVAAVTLEKATNYPDGVFHVSISNNKIYNPGQNFGVGHVQTSGSAVAHGIYASTSGATGYFSDVTVRGNDIYNPAQDGIAVNGIARLTIADNTINTTQADGITVGYGSATDALNVTDFTVTGNVVQGAGTTGIYVTHSSYGRVSNNQIRAWSAGAGTGDRAILVQDSAQVPIQNNAVKNDNASTAFIDVLTSSASPNSGNYYDTAANANLDPANLYVLGTRRTTNRASVPTTGSWNNGDVIWNTAPAASGTRAGWVCATTGTLGTITGVIGTIASGTNQLYVNDATGLVRGAYFTSPGGITPTLALVDSVTTTALTGVTGSINTGISATTLTVNTATGLAVNQYITVAGAGAAGGIHLSKISTIVGTTVTLTTAASTTVSGVAVGIAPILTLTAGSNFGGTYSASGTVTNGSISLSAPVFATFGDVGTVTVANGGTGLTTAAVNTIPTGNGTSAFNLIAAGSADQVLRIPGAGGTAAFGAVDLTKAAAVTGALTVTNGGTGGSSFTAASLIGSNASTTTGAMRAITVGSGLSLSGSTLSNSGVITESDPSSLHVSGGSNTMSQSILANSDEAYNLGSTSAKWNEIYARTFYPTRTASADPTGRYKIDVDGSNNLLISSKSVSGSPGTYVDRILINPLATNTIAYTSNVHSFQDASANTILQINPTNLQASKDIQITSAGKGLLIKEGSNATMGVATLVGGTVVVSTTAVTASSRIFLTGQNSSGTAGELTVSTRTGGTSFTITSASGTDTRDIAWLIINPA